ncbi:unnamed protein product [Dicrocoelium dendriticum]|nr:unnamed protein product [Dicrocoelium dendriticum]
MMHHFTGHWDGSSFDRFPKCSFHWFAQHFQNTCFHAVWFSLFSLHSLLLVLWHFYVSVALRYALLRIGPVMSHSIVYMRAVSGFGTGV